MRSGCKIIGLWVIGLFQFFFCAAQTGKEVVAYAGCTPGDEELRKMLKIADGKVIDFVRWSLQLNEAGTFQMDYSYGESRPNTLALKADSIHLQVIGTFNIEQPGITEGFRQVYHFKTEKEGIDFRMVKVTENLFHILTARQQLMVGNGGWSYQLNRKEPVPAQELFIQTRLLDDTSGKMVFDGRTPCRQIAADHPEMKKSDACFKLKWRLILYRDPVSRQPTTYSFRKIIDNQPQQATGRWTMRKGVGALMGSVIYTIDPEDPHTTMSFLVGDDNVLIFLDKQMRPYPGNEHFSVALNRRRDL